jgi:hypothetical protein
VLSSPAKQLNDSGNSVLLIIQRLREVRPGETSAVKITMYLIRTQRGCTVLMPCFSSELLLLRVHGTERVGNSFVAIDPRARVDDHMRFLCGGELKKQTKPGRMAMVVIRLQSSLHEYAPPFGRLTFVDLCSTVLHPTKGGIGAGDHKLREMIRKSGEEE